MTRSEALAGLPAAVRAEVEILEPQVAEVPLRLSAFEGAGIEIGQPQSGPIMRAIATRSTGVGLASVAVYAHQSDVP